MIHNNTTYPDIMIGGPYVSELSKKIGADKRWDGKFVITHHDIEQGNFECRIIEGLEKLRTAYNPNLVGCYSAFHKYMRRIAEDKPEADQNVEFSFEELMEGRKDA